MLAPVESDAQLLTSAVRDLARRTRFPVAFGGFERDGAVHVSSMFGNRTHSLDNLVVREHRGLGGRAMTELRPRMTPDYGASRHITHDYDRHILGEGLASLLAVPVVVEGSTRAVLYGGTWANQNLGDVVAAAAFQVAEAFGNELRIRDEVRRRIDAHPVTAPSPAGAGLAAAQKEELRESYAELRSIASGVENAAIRARLEAIEKRLAALTGDEVGGETPLEVKLSPRETDVLACAALGSTNAQIAATLGLREGTVKAYLAAAMSKLDAGTRHAAVAKARRAGILP